MKTDVHNAPDRNGGTGTTGSLTVLLVEDNPGDMRLAEEHLRGHRQIDVALYHERTLQGALDALDGLEPDLALLDLGLPDADRLTAVDAVREERPHLPVVVLTGRADRDLALEAVQRGAQDFLSKHELTSEALWRTVRRAVERASGEERLCRSKAIYEAVFRSLEDHVAVVDDRGHITAVNPAWRGFWRENGGGEGGGSTGSNYLEITRRAADDGEEGAAETLDGIGGVLAGDRERYSATYPCHAPDLRRWFRMSVIPMALESEGAVIVHTDVTKSRRR